MTAAALLAAIAMVWMASVGRSSHIEDVLETEIDPRVPRSFLKPTEDEFLAARPRGGFNWIVQNFPDGSQNGHRVPNWELFALRYWYETRAPNSSCPMPPTAVAQYMDWALMVPCLFGDVSIPPRTIFVQNYMLPHFIESTLHFMEDHHRFVLVTGGTDLTIPRSMDDRYQLLRGFAKGSDGGAYFQKLVTDPRLVHWFAENHDLAHPKISTLPTGFSVPNPADLRRDYPPLEQLAPLLSRAPTVVVADRIRTGTGTWALRAEVFRMCTGNPLCALANNGTVSPEGVDHGTFVRMVLDSQFVACTRGGGLDPSPKAWEALYLGAIPIIQHGPLDDGYEHFPVIFVNDWKEVFENPDISRVLAAHAQRLAQYFEKGSELRNKVLHKLKSDYWLGKISDKLRDYDKNHPEEVAKLKAKGAKRGLSEARVMDLGSLSVTQTPRRRRAGTA